MGTVIVEGSLPDFFAVLLANLDHVTWMKHDIPLEMMDLYNTLPGHGPFINTTTVSGLGAVPEKTPGANSATDAFYAGFDKKFSPTVYSLMYGITKEAVDRNEYLNMLNSSKALERSFRATKETKLAAPINDGFDIETSADGKYIFATDHLSEAPGGSARRNTLSSDADLSVASYQLAINDYCDTRDGRGLLLNLRPGRLVVPPENEWLAFEITQSQGRSDTANRADNAFKMSSRSKGIQVVSKSYLTDADGWGLWPSDNMDHELSYVEWEAFQTYAWKDPKPDVMWYKAREGYTFGCRDFVGIFYVQGT